jgi:hypothetical protein
MIRLGGRSCMIFSLCLVFPLELVRQIEMCRNETYSSVRAGKYLSTVFPNKNDLKKGDFFIAVAFQLYCRIYK